MLDEQRSTEGLAADAAEDAAMRTAESIDRAAERNDDPVVAEALQEAALAADTTVSRVGWLRSTIHRLFNRP